MRVEYEKPMMERIIEAREEADKNLQRIECIWLTEDEYEALRRELGYSWDGGCSRIPSYTAIKATIGGRNERPDSCRYILGVLLKLEGIHKP